MAVKLKSRLKHKALIDITSLIDLIFLLVAFFMVTSSLSSESSITVHLPKAVQAGQYKSGNIILSINGDNAVFLNDKEVPMKSLVGELKKRHRQNNKIAVVIRGDRKANYETIVMVMDKLNQAGIPKFAISTTR